MDKFEFITELRAKLWALPEEDRQRSVDYYSEMIDDRMEDGLTQEEAVAAVGSAEEIAMQLLSGRPTKKKRKWTGREITLLILGAPVWVSVLIAAFAVVFSVIAALWSVFGALAASGIACVVSGIGIMIAGKVISGIAIFSAGAVCCGLSIFVFYGAKLSTGAVTVSVKKYFLTRKEHGKCAGKQKHG